MLVLQAGFDGACLLTYTLPPLSPKKALHIEICR